MGEAMKAKLPTAWGGPRRQGAAVQQRRGLRSKLLDFGKAVTVAASIVAALPTTAFACTQIYMGPQTTSSGDTYVGRSEDYAPRHSKVFGVQEPRTNPTFSTYENFNEGDFTWTYTGTTYRYTYVRDSPTGWGGHTDAYGEAGTNQMGVSVSATDTIDANNSITAVDPGGADAQTNTGLGEYNAADIVLSCSSSARAGVQLLGQIIDAKGAYDYNSIIIADANETWDFLMVSGHQWIAINMTKAFPASISVNPNMGNLKYDVDLSDTTVCLHSAGLESTAKEAGTATYFSDGNLDVATSYGLADSGAAQFTRYVQTHSYFGSALAAGTDYTLGTGSDGWSGVATLADPQLFFLPAKQGSITLYQALRSYSTRGEGLSGLNANASSSVYAVGNVNTVETHMFDIRNGLDPSIATVQWEALSRDEFSIALPSYSALLTQVDKTIYPTADAQTWAQLDASYGPNNDGSYDSLSDALNGDIQGMPMDYVLMDINSIAYNNRSSMAEGTRAYLDALQKDVIAQQEAVDTYMQSLPAEKRSDFANSAFDTVSKQVYAKLQTLLQEMRDYYNGTAGSGSTGSKNESDGSGASSSAGTSGAFVPSDYDASQKSLCSPLLYSNALIAPTVSSQPLNVQVSAGDSATLSVSATENDGVTGSDAKLTYQWYRKGSNGATEGSGNQTPADQAIGGATSASFSPDTSAEGSATYYCVVTNESGVSTTSGSATVSVTAKAAGSGTASTAGKGQQKDNSSTGANDPTGDGNANNDAKNKTSDNTAKDASGDTSNASDTQPAKATDRTASESLPKSGDSTNFALSVALVVCGVVLVVIGVVRRRHE